MKIILAPDSFKGSLSAKLLCSAMRDGIEKANLNCRIIELPLADGGEGTMENLVYATGGNTYQTEVLDPLRRKIKARYGTLGDNKTVIIEMAQASGLPLLTYSERNPMVATSYGTGQLITSALNDGYRNFIIGLGGSGTNDGGVGMLKALGVKLYNLKGEIMEEDHLNYLNDLGSFDMQDIDPRLEKSTFTIASDVNNPLCGPSGASAIFGPQKGATHEMIELFDRSLYHYASVIQKQFGIDILQVPGSGAAGGMGAALIAFLQAEMKSGIDITMDFINIKEEMTNADLLITGEGKLDEQTLSGKVIAGVCKIAKEKNVPVIALCGTNELTGKQMDEIGLQAAYSIVPGPCTLKESVKRTKSWTTDCMEQIIRLLYL